MITRRKVVIALGAGAFMPLASFAQQPVKVWRIGMLAVGSGSVAFKSNLDALRAGLRELGYVEGKNLTIEYRWAEGNAERLPAMAAELVRLNVDLIVAPGHLAVAAASKATSTIPIVTPTSGDLVALGVAKSLAKPGGNVTGQVYFSENLIGKRIEFLKEAIPRLTRIAVLGPEGVAMSKGATDALTAAATSLKVAVPFFTARSESDFESAFVAMVKQRAGALLVYDNAIFNAYVATSADLALKHRIPSCGILSFAEAGGMLGYGANFVEMWRHAAVFIDKIFKGAKPGDIPIEQATKFELIVNLKTAKALGIKIPQSVLVQATKVIE